MPSSARSVLLCSLVLALSVPAHAQRRIEVSFTPVARAQLAIWLESADGERFQTLRLTQSVSYRGIGNRPGALQMNSGYLWPFGRREGVLPIWAHRRSAYEGDFFRRVIFNGRASEGNASSAGSSGEPRNTPDAYFCLSFQRERSGRDALDAMTCASQFMSNKGRYLTEADQGAGYSEPYVFTDGARMRPMGTTSLYPPRRDLVPCSGAVCGDHANVADFAADARRVMPEIDAITMATPQGSVQQRIVWDVPEDWPEGDYRLFVEANVEGDYNESYNDTTFPTPRGPAGSWDHWAVNFGYAYRGQPSVLYEVPFELSPLGGTASTTTISGYGALHGEDGELRPADETISDASGDAPGSGADRLLGGGAARLSVTVPMWDVCNQPEPPAMCGRECETHEMCGEMLLCGEDFSCVGICDVPMNPSLPAELMVVPHSDERHAHQWAELSFRVPESRRSISRYEVRFSADPITDLESFERALPAVQAHIENIELIVPVEGAPGDLVEIQIGGLSPVSHYWVAMRTFDACNAGSELAVAEVDTTEIFFTTVSPCFVATAAYGSPMASEIGALRRFRDRHLRSNALGRQLVAAYHAVGPSLARAIEGSDERRSWARAALGPAVALARWLD